MRRPSLIDPGRFPALALPRSGSKGVSHPLDNGAQAGPPRSRVKIHRFRGVWQPPFVMLMPLSVTFALHNVGRGLRAT